MPGADIISNVGIMTAVLAMVGSVIVARIQSRGNAAGRAETRIVALEAQVEKGQSELAAARVKHMEAYERLLDEEEEMRDQHAERVTALRERVDDQRVQLMALRSELIRRGVNPDRVLGEPVAA